MQPLNRLSLYFNAGIAIMFAFLAIHFSGLAEPWLPIFCGLAAATAILDYKISSRCFLFLLVTSISFLDNSPWFFGPSTAILGLAALVGTMILHFVPAVIKSGAGIRIIQVIPFLLIVFLMPFPTSIFTRNEPKRAILNGGVWATMSHLPKAEAALSTQHQYTYENLRETLDAKVLSPDDPLEKFDEFIIITPTIPFTGKYIQSIRDWTRQGGRLIIIADHTNLFGHQTVLQPLTAGFGIGLRPDALFETETNGGIYGNVFNKFTGLTPCSISRGVIPRLKMAGWSENPDYSAPSFFGDMTPSNDDQFGCYPILGSRRFGLGEVAVFTDSTFFANFAINRWSSQSVLASLLWDSKASAIAIFGLLIVVSFIFKPAPLILLVGGTLVIFSPSAGFSENLTPKANCIVTLKPPNSVVNNSEERDRGQASAILSSAYAFDVGIKWDKAAPNSFRDHIQKNGMSLATPATGASIFTEFPPFDLQQIARGEFYIDQNSFWYGQGAGVIRTANMCNFWKSLGANLDSQTERLTATERVERILRSPDGQSHQVKLVNLPENWTIINQRIVAKWVPKSKKWLARKEWQLGPWLKKDLVFDLGE
jgi:hypothetical protein